MNWLESLKTSSLIPRRSCPWVWESGNEASHYDGDSSQMPRDLGLSTFTLLSSGLINTAGRNTGYNWNTIGHWSKHRVQLKHYRTLCQFYKTIYSVRNCYVCMYSWSNYVCISRSNVHVNNAPTAVTPAINQTPMETFFAKFPTTTMTTTESICNEREHELLSYGRGRDFHTLSMM